MAKDHRLDPPDEGVLYVARQGGRVRTSGGRIIVESADKVELLSLPQSHVARVVCFGSVGLSAGARDWAFENGRQVVFFSRRGSYRGQLVGANGKSRVSRLRSQLSLADDRALRIARRCLEGKLLKQSVLLSHFVRDDNAQDVSPAIRQIESLLPMLNDVTAPQS